MRVDFVRHWMGKDVPKRFQTEGPFEVSNEELRNLISEYDVAFMHHGATPGPRRHTLPLVQLGLWLDELGGRFRQR